MTAAAHGVDSAEELAADVERLRAALRATVSAREGEANLALVEEVRQTALALRAGRPDGRAALARRIADLDLDALELLARTFTVFFHLINSAEEQHRLRVLRRRDQPGAPPEGSIAAVFSDGGRARPDDVRALLDRLFVMPV
ncbi:MAG: phosphoenolpyruvate carboxylase, partial [Polyangia bacterium]